MSNAVPSVPRLCDFHPLFRLGMAILAICLVGGYIVSGVYLHQHYEMRDERAGLTLDDIEGAYHGVTSPSPMLRALEGGHPADLDPDILLDEDRDALIAWLRSDTVRDDYENFDLGDQMPADIIAVSCLDCHARDATGNSAGEHAVPDMSLEYPEEVFALAESTRILPKDTAIVVQSLHAHAPSMAVCTIALALLGGMTRFPRTLMGLTVFAAAAGLLADLVGQYMANVSAREWVYAIVGGGFISGTGVTLLGVAVCIDAVIPRTKPKARSEAAA